MKESFSLALDNFLNSLDSNDTINTQEVAEQLKMQMTKRTLKKEYPEEKVKYRTDGRCYVYIKRKQYIAPTYDLLIDKIYDEYMVNINIPFLIFSLNGNDIEEMLKK